MDTNDLQMTVVITFIIIPSIIIIYLISYKIRVAIKARFYYDIKKRIQELEEKNNNK